MITLNTYDQLKEKFGDVASWAIWATSPDGRTKSGIADLSVFDDPGLLLKLNTEYMFIGLNAAAHGETVPQTWGAFHSSCNKKQNDYKLRYAMKGTRFWGSYITDLFKNHIETDSGTVYSQVRKDPSLLLIAKQQLLDELSIINSPVTLIAFGNMTYKYLSKIENSFPANVNIVKLRHFSAWGGEKEYKEIFDKTLNGI